MKDFKTYIDEPKILARYIYEGIGFINSKFCKECDSSLKRKWIILTTKECIQPKCKNYYKKKK